MSGNEKWDQLSAVLARSQKLLETTWDGDEDEVAIDYNKEAASKGCTNHSCRIERA